MADRQDVSIAVIGIGAVGGYLGALLSRSHQHVTMIDCDPRLELCKTEGLHLISDKLSDDAIILAHDTAGSIRDVERHDVVFVCVKRNNLDAVVEDIALSASKGAIVVPIMNGVDHGEFCREGLPDATVIEGLVYIVVERSGMTVHQQGPYAHVHVSPGKESDSAREAVKLVHDILGDASIDCVIERDIDKALWEKYIFNCAFNMITARYAIDADGIRSSDHLNDYLAIVDETYALALRKGVKIRRSVIDRQNAFFMKGMGGSAISSLRRDIDRGVEGELFLFGGWPVREAENLGLDMPVLSRHYTETLELVKENKERSYTGIH